MNSFLFRGGQWAVEELADPFDGWDFGIAVNAATAMPVSDMYGRLHVYLQAVLDSFLTSFMSHDVIFELLHAGPEHLHTYMREDSLARIDVSGTLTTLRNDH